MNGKKAKEYKGAGHRKRLKERFLQSGLDGFLDYEIVELLLTLGTPRRDCKQPAKEAISKFKSLIGVLDATVPELQLIKGIGPTNAIGIKLFQAINKNLSTPFQSSQLFLLLKMQELRLQQSAYTCL